MFVPIGPAVKTVVKNKVVVESDTILPIKELGENLKISTINNVETYEFENCLSMILESNEKVMFHTIQYSKKEKKIYFYTDKEVNIERWEQKSVVEHPKMTNKREVIEEIQNLLKKTTLKRAYEVSLLEIIEILTEREKEKKKQNKSFKKKLKKISKQIINEDILLFYTYYEKEKKLKVCIKDKVWKEIYFEKEEDDVVITKSEINNPEIFLLHLGETISNIFDFYQQVEKENKEQKENISTLNSKFCVDITADSVNFYLKSEQKEVFKSFVYISSLENRLKCNSYFLLSFFKEKEEEILKRIFISIDDCPLWIKTRLLKKEQERLEQMKYQREETEAKRNMSILERIKKALW